MERPLRILFASPAYWPAHAFGGPVVVARELVSRLVARGHDVEVVTTTLRDVGERPRRTTTIETVDGARVTYLGTPLRYRWMGITPTLPLALRRLPRPSVAHVMGFRDPVTTAVASWCRLRRVPYVFEPVGMFRPRLRKVRLKRAFDATLVRGVASGARLVIVSSSKERDDVVGRIAAEKGVEHLVAAARRLPEAHVVLVGPDDRHGTMAAVHGAENDPATAGRIHRLPPTAGPPFDLYRRADVFVLASGGENFGLVAAEAASVGTPVVVSDRTGVAASFREGEALVIPYDEQATVDAISRVLGDAALRGSLAEGALRAARRTTWDAVVDEQVAIYEEAMG